MVGGPEADRNGRGGGNKGGGGGGGDVQGAGNVKNAKCVRKRTVVQELCDNWY